jgi:transcriptional regulator with XRE-family HTH domain
LSSAFFRLPPVARRYERVKVPEETLGAAFRAQRWRRRLEQSEAAEEIGVSVATYRGWETNRRRPDLRHIPAAIQFLGFDWRERGGSLGERLRHARTVTLRVDPTTLGTWEAGLRTLSRKSAAAVRDWLHSHI